MQDEVIASLGNNPVCYRHRFPAIFRSVFKVLDVDLDDAFSCIWPAWRISGSGYDVLSEGRGPRTFPRERRDGERQDNEDVDDETATDAIVSDLPPSSWIRVSRQDQ